MTIEPTFREQLIAAGILIPTGVDGLWGRNAVFETICTGLDHAITQAGLDDSPELMRLPPAMPQDIFEKSGYMKNFPHFAGTIHSFDGSDRDHYKLLGQIERGEPWMEQQQSAGLVLTPAACYSVYPILARRGPLANVGALIDVCCWCFRHEPSLEPTRFQFFRMREYVRIGTPAQVMDFREDWITRGKALATSLGLPFEVDIANDPFFGRGGKLMADSQRAQSLKFELLVPVNDGAGPTACLSFNYHMTHFGDTWDLRTSDGEIAHTACCGFGIERLALASLRHHGFELDTWPAEVRATMGWHTAKSDVGGSAYVVEA
jgi:seryl-tRNA synthetase